MSEGQHHRSFDCGPILLGLFGILCGVFVVCAFHYVVIGWCNRRRNRTPGEDHIPGHNQQMSIPITSNSISALKVYVYSEGCKDGTCAVCLSEFVEGEEVRILPDCAHTFHVPCVDMWLYSHPNCPLCRACTTPKKAHVVVSLPSLGEQPPPAEPLASFGELSRTSESLPHSAGLPSPVHNRFSEFDG